MRGPTPPILGEIAERSVRVRTASSTSPTKMPFSEAVPASIMAQPGFTISDLISPGTPVAVIIIS